MHRTETDRAAAETVARYRCLAKGCAWEGLLPKRKSRESRPSLAGIAAWATSVAAPWQARANRASAAIERAAVPIALAGVAVLAIAFGVRYLIAASKPVPAAPLLMAAGEHHEGESVPSDDPLLLQPDRRSAQTMAVQTLAVRSGCVWGQPGRNPYRGTVEEALVTAKLPPEVDQRIAYKVKQGQVDDRLEISKARIQGVRNRRQFDPTNVAMTYGRTLCVNTQVNFGGGRVEQGDLYEATDNEGNMHAVMVPDVCGNVSVLGARMERMRPTVAGVVGERSRKTILGEERSRTFTSVESVTQVVPEPSTLACVLGALAALGVVGANKRRRLRQGRAPD